MRLLPFSPILLAVLLGATAIQGDDDPLADALADNWHGRPADRGANVVVSTVVDVGPMLRDWLRHHLSRVGFDRAIVFLDDPRGGQDDPTGELTHARELAAAAGEDPAVRDGLLADPVTEESLADEWGDALVLVRRGAALETRLERLELWDKFGGFYPFEVQARQLLHLALVANESLALGVDWALHIDNDELWLPPSGEDAVTHFADLSADAVTQAVYANVEMTPQREDVPEGATVFATATEFLRSELCLARGDQLAAARAVRESRPGQIFFTSYWVGKIASRVSTGTIVPHDVTRNAVPERFRDATRIAVFDDAGGPVILHYANAGPEAWRAKYARLGDISDRSFDDTRVDPAFFAARPHARRVIPRATRQLPFARESRDLLRRVRRAAAAAATTTTTTTTTTNDNGKNMDKDDRFSDDDKVGDRDEEERARQIYRDTFVIPDPLLPGLRKTAVLVNITTVARSARGWYARPTGRRIEYRPLPRTETRGFRPEVSVPPSTCAAFPHFVCHTRSIPCCRILSSPAFLFLQYQLGYKGKR
jgi:hypothetical protein